MNQVKTIALDKESHIRNDAPPRAVANSDKKISKPKQTTNLESSNPALTPTANTKTTPGPQEPPARPSASAPSN
jgi:hypothetical protein